MTDVKTRIVITVLLLVYSKLFFAVEFFGRLEGFLLRGLS
jgi:hypothetical protein